MSLKIKNNINSELSIEHVDSTPAVSITSKHLAKLLTVNTIAELRAMEYTPDTLFVSGYHDKGDGAFGSNIFEWDSASTDADNAGTIIQVTGIVTGRYKLRYDGAVNVKWFGAVGDGTTNCSTIVQDIIDAGHKHIVFSAGTYLFNTVLTAISSPAVRVTLQGTVQEEVTLNFKGTGSFIKGLFNLRDLTLDGTGSTTGFGIHIVNAGTPTGFTGELYHQDLEIKNFKYGCIIDSVYALYFTRVKFEENEYGILGSAPDTEYRTIIVFTDCMIRFNSRLGIRLEGGSITTPNISFINTSIETNGLGIKIGEEYQGDVTYAYQAYFNRVSPLSFNNCYFEEPSVLGEKATTKTNMEVQDCTVSYDSCYLNNGAGLDFVGSASLNYISISNTYFVNFTSDVLLDDKCTIMIDNGTRISGTGLIQLREAKNFSIKQSEIGYIYYGDYSEDTSTRNQSTFNKFNNRVLDKTLTPIYQHTNLAAARTSLPNATSTGVLSFDVPSNSYRTYVLKYMVSYYISGTLRTTEVGELTVLAADIAYVSTAAVAKNNTLQVGGGAYTLNIAFTTSIASDVLTVNATATLGIPTNALCNILFIPVTGLDATGDNYLTQL